MVTEAREQRCITSRISCLLYTAANITKIAVMATRVRAPSSQTGRATQILNYSLIKMLVLAEVGYEGAGDPQGHDDEENGAENREEEELNRPAADEACGEETT